MTIKLDTEKAYDRLDKFFQKCFNDDGFLRDWQIGSWMNYNH